VDYIALLGLFVVILVLSYLTWITWPILIGAVYLPTPPETVEKMLEIAEVNKNDTLFDFGSGDGRVIIDAAEKYGARAIGIEADPLRVLWTRNKIKKTSNHHLLQVVWGNFFKTDINKATVVTVYQGQTNHNKLKDKFEKDLKPGTRIVSYSFPFDGWKPKKEDPDKKLYLYIVRDNPAR
jgi:hypothetical protein